jgi:hypothetical protein
LFKIFKVSEEKENNVDLLLDYVFDLPKFNKKKIKKDLAKNYKNYLYG